MYGILSVVLMCSYVYKSVFLVVVKYTHVVSTP